MGGRMAVTMLDQYWAMEIEEKQYQGTMRILDMMTVASVEPEQVEMIYEEDRSTRSPYPREPRPPATSPPPLLRAA